MKISASEIRQQTFEKSFRGYETTEVDAFLATIATEWERVQNECKMLKMQLDIAEKEASKLKEVELSLFKTLKMAEDASANITSQANSQAEKHIEDAKNQGEKVMAEAEIKAKSILKEAEERANYIKEDVLGEVRNLQNEFSDLESKRNGLIEQLRMLSDGTLQHVTKFEEKFPTEKLNRKIEEAESLLETADAEAVAQKTTTETNVEPSVEIAAEEAIAEVPAETESPEEETGAVIPSVANTDIEQRIETVDSAANQEARPEPEDMIDRVNKVKEAIKRAMQDKTEVKADGGSSFFDEI